MDLTFSFYWRMPIRVPTSFTAAIAATAIFLVYTVAISTFAKRPKPFSWLGRCYKI